MAGMSKADVYKQVLAHFGNSPSKLAEELGLGDRAAMVCNWKRRGIPAEYARKIQLLTGISVETLRPDDWRMYWPEVGMRREKATA